MPGRLIVESAGPGATIQDGGRIGLLRFGVTPAGPMDWVAFRTANIALANDPAAAAIEIATGGLSLRVTSPMNLAFAGGGFRWSRNEQTLPAAARLVLRPDERLRCVAGAWGAFGYCAVPGGIDVPEVMGSRATHTRARLGGVDGGHLKGGDGFATCAEGAGSDDVAIEAPWLACGDDPIRVVLGPQDDYFAPASVATLQGAEYELTPTADRMAYKFAGPKLAHAKDFNIISDGIALGAIQVAGDGQPMVLMADRQPTGGYTKIAHVCRADIGRLAQLRPGDRCRFRVVSVAEAREALLTLEDRVATTTAHLVALRRTPTADHLLRSNLIGGVTAGRAD